MSFKLFKINLLVILSLLSSSVCPMESKTISKSLVSSAVAICNVVKKLNETYPQTVPQGVHWKFNAPFHVISIHNENKDTFVLFEAQESHPNQLLDPFNKKSNVWGTFHTNKHNKMAINKRSSDSQHKEDLKAHKEKEKFGYTVTTVNNSDGHLFIEGNFVTNIEIKPAIESAQIQLNNQEDKSFFSVVSPNFMQSMMQKAQSLIRNTPNFNQAIRALNKQNLLNEINQKGVDNILKEHIHSLNRAISNLIGVAKALKNINKVNSVEQLLELNLIEIYNPINNLFDDYSIERNWASCLQTLNSIFFDADGNLKPHSQLSIENIAIAKNQIAWFIKNTDPHAYAKIINDPSYKDLFEGIDKNNPTHHMGFLKDMLKDPKQFIEKIQKSKFNQDLKSIIDAYKAEDLAKIEAILCNYSKYKVEDLAFHEVYRQFKQQEVNREHVRQNITVILNSEFDAVKNLFEPNSPEYKVLQDLINNKGNLEGQFDILNSINWISKQAERMFIREDGTFTTIKDYPADKVPKNLNLPKNVFFRKKVNHILYTLPQMNAEQKLKAEKCLDYIKKTTENIVDLNLAQAYARLAHAAIDELESDQKILLNCSNFVQECNTEKQKSTQDTIVTFTADAIEKLRTDPTKKVFNAKCIQVANLANKLNINGEADTALNLIETYKSSTDQNTIVLTEEQAHLNQSILNVLDQTAESTFDKILDSNDLSCITDISNCAVLGLIANQEGDIDIANAAKNVCEILYGAGVGTLKWGIQTAAITAVAIYAPEVADALTKIAFASLGYEVACTLFNEASLYIHQKSSDKETVDSKLDEYKNKKEHTLKSLSENLAKMTVKEWGEFITGHGLTLFASTAYSNKIKSWWLNIGNTLSNSSIKNVPLSELTEEVLNSPLSPSEYLARFRQEILETAQHSAEKEILSETILLSKGNKGSNPKLNIPNAKESNEINFAKGIQKAVMDRAKEQANGKREVELPKVQTYEQAMNKALEIIGNIDQNTGFPHLGELGVGKGKIVGRKWFDNKVLLRLDYDPVKGPHINLDDCRIGKGPKRIKICIPFNGNEKTVEQLLSHLNTKNNLELAQHIFNQAGNIKDFTIVTETLKKLNKKA